MLRERTELIAFSRDDLERLVRYASMNRITGNMFIGKFGEQSVRWTADGGIEVITKYVEGDLNDLPPPAAPTPAAITSKKKR